MYRRNNLGRPCFWEAKASCSPTQNIIIVSHGIVGKAIQVEEIHVARNPKDEVESRYKQKRKQGYKFLDEIKDDNWSTPVKEEQQDRLFTPDDIFDGDSSKTVYSGRSIAEKVGIDESIINIAEDLDLLPKEVRYSKRNTKAKAQTNKNLSLIHI